GRDVRGVDQARRTDGRAQRRRGDRDGVASLMEGHSTLKAIGRVTAIVLIGIVFLFPLYWMITMSFKPQAEGDPIGTTMGGPEKPTFDNYKQVLGMTNQNTQFFQASSTDAPQPIIHS